MCCRARLMTESGTRCLMLVTERNECPRFCAVPPVLRKLNILGAARPRIDDAVAIMLAGKGVLHAGLDGKLRRRGERPFYGGIGISEGSAHFVDPPIGQLLAAARGLEVSLRGFLQISLSSVRSEIARRSR